MTESSNAPNTRRLPTAVIGLGLTSLLTDVSSEMIFPLLPLLLTSLGAGAAALGLIEGVADAVSSLLKLASGALADRVKRKKPLVMAGYALASFVRPLSGFALHAWQVLAVRVTDRVGKGIRSAPRDAIIAQSVPHAQAGRAFGLHRAMDHAGAVLGPLVAAGLLALGLPLRSVILAAIVPGLLALLVLAFVKEPAPREGPPPSKNLASRAGVKNLPRPLRHYLGVLFLFSLGNSSDAFLLLRARELGVAVTSIPLLWTALHVAKLTSSYAGGTLADRLPRRALIASGWCIYAGCYFALGRATAAWQAWLLFCVYGTYYGLTEPAERAVIKELAPVRAQGLAFGAYHFVVGISAVPAGLLAGQLWKHFGAAAALSLGAALALLSAVLLLLMPAPNNA
ncbi:MAG TPA: MFS transporter [Polyangiaceae bacterium]|nr:MFS transporter [Polyangiaceae bacterium]